MRIATFTYFTKTTLANWFLIATNATGRRVIHTAPMRICLLVFCSAYLNLLALDRVVLYYTLNYLFSGHILVKRKGNGEMKIAIQFVATEQHKIIIILIE